MMIDDDLKEAWDNRWRGSEQAERLSRLGRWMFKAKVKALDEALKGLEFKTVVDAGCGLGHILKYYCDTGYESIGIDFSSSAVAVCRQKGLPAMVGRLEEVDQIYDLVSSDGVLEHFRNFEPHARQLMRLSRRYVLLIQPNHESFAGKTLAYLAELLRKENVFEYNYRMADFTAVFSESGFQLIKNLPVFFDVFRILVFQKVTRP